MFHLCKQATVIGFVLVMLIFNLSLSAKGQTTSDSLPRTQSTSTTVTAASSSGAVRFSAPGNNTRIRLEVYSPTGEKVFDSGNRDGNVLDWRWQDEKSKVLSREVYLCVVTVQSLSGDTSRKLTNVSFANEQATLQPVDTTQISPAQAQVVGTTETEAPLTIIASEQPMAATVIANDGSEGQMIRGRGALTFRIGNFFTGVDQEQMRLTEAGDLGIGTSAPQAKLDVAGTVRAQRFLLVKPSVGPGDKTAAATQASDGAESVQPLVGGTGTTDRLTKWTDGSMGTLGDSGITETAGGNVGIGTTSPGAKLEVGGTVLATGGFRDSGTAISRFENTFAALPTGAAGKAVEIGVESGTDGLIQTYNRTAGALIPLHFAGSKFYFTTGNVGIGTSAPGTKLDVAGTINTSTQYNIAGIRVLDILGSNTFAGVNAGISNAGTFNTFVGYMAGSSKNGGDGNSFFGSFAGNSNSGGNGNAFFGFEAGKANINGESNSFFGSHAGRQNQNAAGNSFFGYLSGQANTSGEFNSFFGKEAGSTNTTGSFNVSIGYAAGTGPFAGNASGTNNVSIGYAAGTITGAGQSGNNNNIFIGAGARGDDQEDDNQPLTYATAIGAGTVATRKNTIFLGRSDLGYTLDHPNGGDDVVVGGQLRIKYINSFLGGSIDLCIFDGPLTTYGHGVSTCSSSLRYKTGVQTFLGGLDIVRRLRPITFNWRAGGRRDLGFGAEEVEKIDPLLVVYNEKGEVEGVKYKQMTAVLVNAINEQQTQITEQQRTIEQQKLQLEQKDSQLESLKASVAQQESRLAAIESRLKSLAGTRNLNKPSPTSRPNQ
jgi:hypothetical protein